MIMGLLESNNAACTLSSIGQHFNECTTLMWGNDGFHWPLQRPESYLISETLKFSLLANKRSWMHDLILTNILYISIFLYSSLWKVLIFKAIFPKCSFLTLLWQVLLKKRSLLFWLPMTNLALYIIYIMTMASRLIWNFILQINIFFFFFHVVKT